MESFINVVRTGSLIAPYKCEKRTGANGSFESKSICFNVAVDREQTQIVNENGQNVRRPITDWFAMRVVGNAADIMNTYGTATNNGKLISRRLLVGGHIERYDRTWTNPKGKIKAFDVTLPDGKIYTIPEHEGPTEETYKETILVITSVKFLDSNPVKATGTTTIPSGTPIMAQPVATPTNGIATIASATPVGKAESPAPVQNAPITNFAEQVQQAAAKVAAEQNAKPENEQPIGMPMGMATAPSVSNGFTATSDTAPF